MTSREQASKLAEGAQACQHTLSAQRAALRQQLHRLDAKLAQLERVKHKYQAIARLTIVTPELMRERMRERKQAEARASLATLTPAQARAILAQAAREGYGR